MREGNEPSGPDRRWWVLVAAVGIVGGGSLSLDLDWIEIGSVGGIGRGGERGLRATEGGRGQEERRPGKGGGGGGNETRTREEEYGGGGGGKGSGSGSGDGDK